MDLITNLLYIIFGMIMSIFIHEMTHCIIFRIQKIQIKAFGIFGIHFIKGNIFINLLSSYSIGGYCLIDTSFINSRQEKMIFLKKITINHMCTVLLSTIFAISTAVFLLFIPQNTFLITLFVINLLIVANAFYSDLGDIEVLKSIREDSYAGYLYMISSEILTGFTNKYLYTNIVKYLETVDLEELEIKHKIYILGLIHYVVDYRLYHHIDINDYFVQIIDKYKRTKGIGEYIYYKFQLNQIINGHLKVTDLYNDLVFSNRYIDNFKKFVLKVDRKEKTTYLDLKLQNKYGVLKKDKNVILLLENLYNDIIKSIK